MRNHPAWGWFRSRVSGTSFDGVATGLAYLIRSRQCRRRVLGIECFSFHQRFPESSADHNLYGMISSRRPLDHHPCPTVRTATAKPMGRHQQNTNAGLDSFPTDCCRKGTLPSYPDEHWPPVGFSSEIHPPCELYCEIYSGVLAVPGSAEPPCLEGSAARGPAELWLGVPH